MHVIRTLVNTIIFYIVSEFIKVHCTIDQYPPRNAWYGTPSQKTRAPEALQLSEMRSKLKRWQWQDASPKNV